MVRAVIVAGATASGKSGLAMALAGRLGGVVVNADSMQVYRELRIVTARPSLADEAALPHALYGVRGAACPGNVAWWRRAALEAMAAAGAIGRVPILCGGTGLYLASLVSGLAPVPEVGEGVRAEARELLAAEGAAALHGRLALVDEETAAGLRVGDGQRVARAWEVWRGTGRGLASWQREVGEAAPYDFRMVMLEPGRSEVRGAVEGRFRAMVEAGAVEEVAGLLALGLDAGVPAMRAVGVAELGAHVRGEVGLEDAVGQAVSATMRYVKRQGTWFRHRAPVSAERTHTIHARFAGVQQFSEREWGDIESFISL